MLEVSLQGRAVGAPPVVGYHGTGTFCVLVIEWPGEPGRAVKTWYFHLEAS